MIEIHLCTFTLHAGIFKLFSDFPTVIIGLIIQSICLFINTMNIVDQFKRECMGQKLLIFVRKNYLMEIMQLLTMIDILKIYNRLLTFIVMMGGATRYEAALFCTLSGTC